MPGSSYTFGSTSNTGLPKQRSHTDEVATVTVHRWPYILDSLPAFAIVGDGSAYQTDKNFFFVVNLSTTVVALWNLVQQIDRTAVVGALSSEWLFQRVLGQSSPPSMTAFTIESHDSNDSVPSGLVSGRRGSGLTGTSQTLLSFVPQPDELKASTWDASNQSSLFDWNGLSLFDARRIGHRPLVIRPTEALQVIQTTTTTGVGRARLVGHLVQWS